MKEISLMVKGIKERERGMERERERERERKKKRCWVFRGRYLGHSQAAQQTLKEIESWFKGKKSLRFTFL